MEVRVFALSGGQLQIFIDGAGATYEEAARATERVLAALRAEFGEVRQTSPIELHRDGGAGHAHVVATVGGGR